MRVFPLDDRRLYLSVGICDSRFFFFNTSFFFSHQHIEVFQQIPIISQELRFLSLQGTFLSTKMSSANL